MLNKFSRKKHKYNRTNTRKCISNAKKGTQLRCVLKTCRANKYKSVYGAVSGGRARENRQLFY